MYMNPDIWHGNMAISVKIIGKLAVCFWCYLLFICRSRIPTPGCQSMRKCMEVYRLQYEQKTCIILAWKTHVRIGWKYSKTYDEGTPLYPGQSVPTWQVPSWPSSQVCPNNMKTPYFKMIIQYCIHISFNSYHAYTYTHPTSYRFIQFDNKSMRIKYK